MDPVISARHSATERGRGAAAAAVDHDCGPELAPNVAGRPDTRAAAARSCCDDPVPQTADGGCGDVNAFPGRAVNGGDPVDILHPPGHATDDCARDDDADAAGARVAGVNRVPGCGDPATARRLRQLDSTRAALRQDQPMARSGEPVHDADSAECDVERLARGAERLSLVDQVGACVHAAARAGAGAVHHVLPNILQVDFFMGVVDLVGAEGLRHGDIVSAVAGANDHGNSRQPANDRRLERQGSAPATGERVQSIGNTPAEVGVEYPGSGHLGVPVDAQYDVVSVVKLVTAARDAVGRVQGSIYVNPPNSCSKAETVQDRDRAGFDLNEGRAADGARIAEARDRVAFDHDAVLLPVVTCADVDALEFSRHFGKASLECDPVVAVAKVEVAGDSGTVDGHRIVVAAEIDIAGYCRVAEDQPIVVVTEIDIAGNCRTAGGQRVDPAAKADAAGDRTAVNDQRVVAGAKADAAED